MTSIFRLRGILAVFLAAVVMFFCNAYPAGSQSTSTPAGAGKGPSSALAELFPAGDQFGNLKKATEPEYYFPDTLFEYINGGAELFLTYGFAELMVAEFVEDGNPAQRATLEIYNMGTVENAFGVFRAEQGGDPYKLPGGAEGRLGHGMLQFYKGTFYVKTFVPPASKAYAAVAKQIGTTIEALIKGTFSPPAFFDLLPVKDRIPDSENYTSRDFLGQPYFTRIASAQFSRDGKTYTVFLSIEPVKEAAESLKKYKTYLIRERAYQGDLPGLQGFAGQDPYYGHSAVSIIRERIAGVLSNPAEAASILKSMGGGDDEKK